MEPKSKSSGYTLIEVTLAIFVLSLALSALIGLQASTVGRVVDDHHRLNAALAAQQIIAELEGSDLPIEPGEDIGSVSEFITQIDNSRLNEEVANYEVMQRITIEGLPDFPDSLRRIFLRISWGPDLISQSYTVQYILPNDDFDDGEEEDF